MNQLILQVFCSFFSGLLQALSISNQILPFGSPFIALFSLVPMYIAFHSARSYRQSFLIFFIETITVHIFSSSWLANFHGYAVFTLGASALGTGLLGGIVGLVVHFFPAQLHADESLEEIGGRRPMLISGRILWFSASWVFWEWIKSTGILAYPWGTVSMAAYRWKIFTQIADITGVWGITFLFTLFSAVLAEGLILFVRIRKSQNPQPLLIAFRSSAKFMAVMFLVCGVYGIIQYVVPRTKVKEMNTVIVQQNADPWEAGDKESIAISTRLTESKIDEMAEKGEDVDLVLWSEGTLNRLFPNSINFYSNYPDEESLTDFIDRMNVPFIIGGSAMMDSYRRKYTNISTLFDRSGNFAGFYSKMHLVPFAELIPLADNPLMSWFMKTVVKMPSSMSPGKQSVTFRIPLVNDSVRGTEAPLEYNMESSALIELSSDGTADKEKARRYIRNPEPNPDAFVTFSTPICFEDAFPDVCRRLFADGSEVFMNITNDSWSKNAAAEYQHFIAASYLSIEFRTTLVRCCNSGYSAVVGPNGKVLYDMPIFTEDALAVSIPIYERKETVFARFGDWFAYAVMTAMAVYFLISAVQFHGLSKKLPKISITFRGRTEALEEANDSESEASQSENPETKYTESIREEKPSLWTTFGTRPFESATPTQTSSQVSSIKPYETKPKVSENTEVKATGRKSSVKSTEAEVKATGRKSSVTKSTEAEVKSTGRKSSVKSTEAEVKVTGRKSSVAKSTEAEVKATGRKSPVAKSTEAEVKSTGRKSSVKSTDADVKATGRKSSAAKVSSSKGRGKKGS